MVALGDAQRVDKGENIVDILGLVTQIPVTGLVEGVGIMVPGRRGIGLGAVEEELDHVAAYA